MHGSRPPWYRTARSIGGTAWVPFEVARALQDQLDAHRQRLHQAEQELGETRATVQRLALQARQHGDGRDLEQLQVAYRERMVALERELAGAEARLTSALELADQARAEAEAAREQAREAAERLADCEPAPSDESARIQRLTEDLARVRARTEAEVATARAAERDAALLRLAEVHDDLHRGLAALPDDPSSPWFAGYRAVLQQIEAQLAQAGARPYGAPGDAFDPALHEAVGTTPDPDHAGLVVKVARTGFALEGGGLLRAAQVVVGT